MPNEQPWSSEVWFWRQIWLLRMVLALYAIAMYAIYVLLGAPESSSTVVLAYMFTAVYADYDLGHYGSTTRHYAPLRGTTICNANGTICQ